MELLSTQAREEWTVICPVEALTSFCSEESGVCPFHLGYNRKVLKVPECFECECPHDVFKRSGVLNSVLVNVEIMLSAETE